MSSMNVAFHKSHTPGTTGFKCSLILVVCVCFQRVFSVAVLSYLSPFFISPLNLKKKRLFFKFISFKSGHSVRLGSYRSRLKVVDV